MRKVLDRLVDEQGNLDEAVIATDSTLLAALKALASGRSDELPQ
jgi:hypothetical protein